MNYFFGADVGSSKTHVLVTDETGRVLGAGTSGAGNHEVVGYDGLVRTVKEALSQALAAAQLRAADLTGAGLGISGYDWPSETEPTLTALAELGLAARISIVNDALIGLLAGAQAGWGIAVVAGSGCNCRGWDRARQRTGQVTGAGMALGEAAGASDVVQRAIQAISHAWTRRGPTTRLTEAFVEYTGARGVTDLLDGLVNERYRIPGRAAPLVFRIAAEGDAVAGAVIRWAGQELGELVNAVVRQLDFQALEFEVVFVGNLFNGGELLVGPLQDTVCALAPHARFVRLQTPPVVGAILLAMEDDGVTPTPAIRTTLMETARQWLG